MLLKNVAGTFLCADEFLLTPAGMIFESCVMRLQSIGGRVGKLLKELEAPFSGYEAIPWGHVKSSFARIHEHRRRYSLFYYQRRFALHTACHHRVDTEFFTE